ncbi:VOC family protein [Lysobacter sp. TY2-98]|uniref:VOC family protein n=1 Tax=Lysobacter sp. TY2-98 TaxID=2290922 RepID=UPI000E203F5F|nr:VOC family protein [Lysobacter sp. TY2-98]AXK72038.1 VOC family protein [Lysobacter sp. TY2-98]
MSFNPVNWFEIYVDDMARARRFYETVLERRLSQLPSPEIQMWAFDATPDQPGAGGALVHYDGLKAGGASTIVYFRTADCAVEASRVEAAGGRIHKPKMSIGPYGFIALAVDTEGNMFGLHSMA